MIKRKEIISLFCCLAVIISVGLLASFNFLMYGTITVYRQSSPNGKMNVQIKGSTGFFEFTPRGGFDYELIVSNKDFFSTPVLSEKFHFNADGAPIKDDCVSVAWFENHVEIEIDNKQHQVNSIKKFVCYF